MRYKRIEHILTKDKALASRLSEPTETVMKPNGQSQLFPREVVEVTERLQAENIDPQHANRRTVLQAAIAVFSAKRKTARAVPAAPKPAKAKKPAKVKIKVKKPRAKKLGTKRARASKTKVRAEKPPPAEETIPEAPEAIEPPEAPVSKTGIKVVGFPFTRVTSLQEVEFLPTEALAFCIEEKKIVMGMQVLVTLLIFASNMAEAVDGLPGNVKRKEALQALVKDYSKLNVVEHIKEERGEKTTATAAEEPVIIPTAPSIVAQD